MAFPEGDFDEGFLIFIKVNKLKPELKSEISRDEAKGIQLYTDIMAAIKQVKIECLAELRRVAEHNADPLKHPILVLDLKRTLYSIARTKYEALDLDASKLLPKFP